MLSEPTVKYKIIPNIMQLNLLNSNIKLFILALN